jgi:hypothetical protein
MKEGISMVKETKRPDEKVIIEVSFKDRPEFKGEVAAFVFDASRNLIEIAKVKAGKFILLRPQKELRRSRLFLAPVPENLDDVKPTLNMMERLGAYEHVIWHAGKLVDSIRIPGTIIDRWPICLCWVRGRVVKAGSALPVCGARVHICEVDKLWLWLLKLPELEVLRLRDELLKIFDEPLQRWPRPPEPDPSPFRVVRTGLVGLGEVTPQPEPAIMQFAMRELTGLDMLSPQPEPPDIERYRPSLARLGVDRVSSQPEPATEESIHRSALALSAELQAALSSNSAQIVRQALIDNLRLILPFLCLWPRWWWFRCDEIAVIETNTLGRFQTIIPYLCSGDKPDLYFWVEYEIDGTWETVYRPPKPCFTYWDYQCGTEVTIPIQNERVPACDDEPDLPGCEVQVLSIGRTVSTAEIQGDGVVSAIEGLTSDERPFGGKLEPRVWFSRSVLREDKDIHYYRWSYRRLTEGDGSPLAAPDPWTPLTRTVVRHYAKPTPGGVTHEPYTLGPKTIGTQTNLFEIKPEVPTGGVEWTVVDEREDLASAHFETSKLGSGTGACTRAYNAAGKYELKLELFKDTGDIVDWTTEGIDLRMADVAAPFGTDAVTTEPAPDYNRIPDTAGNTIAFRMVLRVDNNCCRAEVRPVTGVGLDEKPCGFVEFTPAASATLHFRAVHPNNFADFRFRVKRGVNTHVRNASVRGRTGTTSVNTDDATHAYTLTLPSDYRETFTVTELLAAMRDMDGVWIGPCSQAAFSEALHVWARATNGYSRLWRLDAFDHDGFALVPAP